MKIVGSRTLNVNSTDLTTVVKSVNYGGARPKQINNANSQGNDNRSGRKGPASSEGSQPRPHPNKPSLPFKGKGPATMAVRPFKDGSRPYQCYTCGGWGHSWHQCLSSGGPGLEGFKWI